jgi:hypothetical protein
MYFNIFSFTKANYLLLLYPRVDYSILTTLLLPKKRTCSLSYTKILVVKAYVNKIIGKGFI